MRPSLSVTISMVDYHADEDVCVLVNLPDSSALFIHGTESAVVAFGEEIIRKAKANGKSKARTIRDGLQAAWDAGLSDLEKLDNPGAILEREE